MLRITFFAPAAKWADAFSIVVNLPVDSSTISTPSSFQGRRWGSLIEKILINFTNENDTILDPFMGSGSVGVSAVKNNRNFVGIELDENYFNIAISRIKEVKKDEI